MNSPMTDVSWILSIYAGIIVANCFKIRIISVITLLRASCFGAFARLWSLIHLQSIYLLMNVLFGEYVVPLNTQWIFISCLPQRVPCFHQRTRVPNRTIFSFPFFLVTIIKMNNRVAYKRTVRKKATRALSEER